MQASLVSFHVILCLTNIICLGFTSTFDTLCAVKHSKSVINCTEEVVIAKPQLFVLVFYSSTVINASVVIITLYFKPDGVKFLGFKEALKKLGKKGSFWSYIITYMFIVSEYIMAIVEDLEFINRAIAITAVLFLGSKLIVAFFLNYVPPVSFPKENERRLTTVYICFAYWMILVLFFLASAHITLAFTLDVAEKVSLLGKVKTGSHNFEVVIRLVFLGMNATFSGRLFLFYWNKFFHGKKDLFSTLSKLAPIIENES